MQYLGLGWVGLGWVGLGWVGLGWVGLGLLVLISVALSDAAALLLLLSFTASASDRHAFVDGFGAVGSLCSRPSCNE
jgi:hypothetical protein